MYSHTPRRVLRILCVLLPVCFPAFANAAEPAADPPELIVLRDAYEASLAPLRAKVEEAVKVRTAEYVAGLQKVEEQATASGRIEAVPLLRAEREAFASGTWTAGFPANNKAVPSAALELRRAFDRDCAKFRADIVPAARPLLTDYLRKLDELDKRLTAAKTVDGALAVREEKKSLQGSGADPLTGTNSLVVGTWLDEKGKEFEFSRTGTVPGGKWVWTDRSKRELRINWNAGPKFYLNLTVSPDGSNMAGVNATGGKRHYTRKKP
jgi:hypothetical protein